jgi:tRNA A37 threonylcarbamoyladenosine modification protein TsaB
MYKIYIDASKRYNKSVSLLKDSALLRVKSGDIDITSSIGELLKEFDLKISDIARFESNLGPGESFTGLKIGAVIANVLNWSVKNEGLSDMKYPDYGREPNISERRA